MIELFLIYQSKWSKK